MKKTLLTIIVLLIAAIGIYFAFFYKSTAKIPGQCNAECNAPRVYGPPNNRQVVCDPVPACTNCPRPDPNRAVDCACHLYKKAKRNNRAEWELIEETPVAYDSLNFFYRCYCVQL